jgi:hypothetical protein
VLITGFLLLRDRTPVLEVRTLEEARARWERNGVSDYDLDIVQEPDARPAERLLVEVRGGRAVRLLRDGKPVDTRDAYTVPGLFGIIEREVEMATASSPSEGAPRNAVLKALFDDELGYPALFKRLAPRRSLVITVELRNPEPNAGR